MQQGFHVLLKPVDSDDTRGYARLIVENHHGDGILLSGPRQDDLALTTLHRQHVSENIALVGFDDILLAEYFDPPLTTIRLPAFGLGWAGGERSIRIIQGDDLNDASLFLESKLITRQSSL